MSRITRCICDGCGKELTVEPIQIFAELVDLETGTLTTREPAGYYSPQKDFCENCMKRIMDFVDGMASKIEEPVPALDKMSEKEPMQPKIQKLLRDGKGIQEIVDLLGCKKQAVYAARNQLKKKASEEASAVKTYNCSEVQKNCAYKTRLGSGLICDYLGITGHSRGCPPEECTVYRKEVMHHGK